MFSTGTRSACLSSSSRTCRVCLAEELDWMEVGRETWGLLRMPQLPMECLYWVKWDMTQGGVLMWGIGRVGKVMREVGGRVGLSIWKEVLRIWVDVRKIAILVNSAD